jgi:hypothetical protein
MMDPIIANMMLAGWLIAGVFAWKYLRFKPSSADKK